LGQQSGHVAFGNHRGPFGVEVLARPAYAP
jgi:hypothetical protein